MTEDILRVMEERQSYKYSTTDEGKAKYQELKSKFQMLSRKTKDRYFEDKCLELEMLDKTHSQKLYDKVKELQPRKHRVMHQIKGKNDRLLLSKTEIVERWAEYVEELYEDNRADKDMGDTANKMYLIGENEVKEVIDNLPKGKATGEDNIPAELLQCMGESGLQIMTKLINKIYNVGYIPDDFAKAYLYLFLKLQKLWTVVIIVQLH